ncbi:hypothetical protein CQA4T8M7_11430 [Sphaerotilus natans]|jgi:hypothetical protein|nr:hypothetical protein CQA4T8M7_11430 [Sphaerotilus natans]
MSPHLHHRPDALWVAQIEKLCEELNLRIARLALMLGVSLDDEAQLARLLAPVARPDGHDRPSERHEADARTELRGLLLLRGELEKRCVDEFGPVTAGEMLIDVEAAMVRHGFAPGADGLDLQRLFGSASA